MSRDVLKQLSDPTLVAVCCAGRDWPRSFLGETLIPDKWMGLIEKPDGRRWYLPAGEDPNPADADTLMLVRNRPLTIPVELTGIPASDGAVVDVAAEVIVRWQSREHDLAALRQRLLDEPTLALDKLARAFVDGGGANALRDYIRAHTARELVHNDRRDAFLEHLNDAVKPFLFESGMIVERVAKLTFASDTLAKQEQLERETAERVERIRARQMVEQASIAATKRRLDDLGDILGKLEAAATGDDTMRWHDLLPALSPLERGRLLENLWRITPNRRVLEAIVAVAGQEVLWLQPEDLQNIAQRAELDPKLGALRSVAVAENEQLLLVGCARGVWTLDARSGDTRKAYEIPTEDLPRTGCNAAAVARGRLFATHSQLGAWSWPLDDPTQPEPMLRPIEGTPRTIRAILTTGTGQIAFAADRQVHLWEADLSANQLMPELGDTITCLGSLGNKLYAGTAEGTLAELDLVRPEGWLILHKANARFESVLPRGWSDLVELVIPAGAGGVCGVYAQEGVVARLLASDMPVRRAWASDDAVVALNDRRDALIILNANRQGRSLETVPLARLVGRSIQDVCLIARDENQGTIKADNQANLNEETS